MWESRCFGEISKTLWERWESCFWISKVSTPSPFPQLSGVFWPHVLSFLRRPLPA